MNNFDFNVGDVVRIENGAVGKIVCIANLKNYGFYTYNDNFKIIISCKEKQERFPPSETRFRYAFHTEESKDTVIERHPSNITRIGNSTIQGKCVIGTKNTNGDEVIGVMTFGYYKYLPPDENRLAAIKKWSSMFDLSDDSLIVFAKLNKPVQPLSFSEFEQSVNNPAIYTNDYLTAWYDRIVKTNELAIPECVFETGKCVI
jgi:hypothetical protein